MTSGDWKRVWEERGTDYPLDDPVGLDGFDQAFGKMTPDSVARVAGNLLRALGVGPDQHILDVGCGAGMIMRPLSDTVTVTGTDLAFAMIRRGRELWPALNGLQAGSTHLPFRSACFDGAFSHGVFFYFPGYEYAAGALAEMRRVVRPGGRFVVADIPDVSTKNAYLTARAAAAASGAPVWRSSVPGDPEHLYYERDFFCQWAKDNHCNVEFAARDVPGYLNANFRFDVMFG